VGEKGMGKEVGIVEGRERMGERRNRESNGK
jgi:hypothetical protein